MEQEQFIRKVRKTGTSLGVNIPPEIIELLSINENDIVRVVIEKVER